MELVPKRSIYAAFSLSILRDEAGRTSVIRCPFSALVKKINHQTRVLVYGRAQFLQFVELQPFLYEVFDLEVIINSGLYVTRIPNTR